MDAILGDADVAAVAGVLADRNRAKMLMALGDGRALAASTLAQEAGVAASTASGHLARLVNAGLCQVEVRGRHRYYRLAGPEVSEVLETLARLAPVAPVRSLREGTRAAAVRAARICYDHLAGRLGTAVMDGLVQRGVLEDRDHTGDYRLGHGGPEWLDDLGVKVPTGTRRPLLRFCQDWSEQRPHLGGALGAALLDRWQDLDWVRRSPHSRAVQVTDAGRVGLAQRLGIEVPGSGAAAARPRPKVG